MTGILETIMLICFGLSWPISVYKSATSHSTKGKSLFFILAVIVGYLAGITGKIIGGNTNYVLALYVINLIFVSVDLLLYFRNKKHESKNAHA
ncbi:MAG: hypothetical protein J6Z34_07400 [Clostridia bacterium]|nr:hypothetical protein [Clostridia bacterium]